MNNQPSRDIERGTAAVLLLGVVAAFIGTVMFFLRGGMEHDIPAIPPASYTWERGFILGLSFSPPSVSWCL